MGKNAGLQISVLREWVGAEMARLADGVREGAGMDQARLDELTLTLLVTELAAEVRMPHPDRFAMENLVKTMGGYRNLKKGPGGKGMDGVSDKEAEEFARKMAEERGKG